MSDQVSGLQEIAQHYAQQAGGQAPTQQPPQQQQYQQPPPQQQYQQPPQQQYQQPPQQQYQQPPQQQQQQYQQPPQPLQGQGYDIPPNVAPALAQQHAQTQMPFNPPEAQQAISGGAQQTPQEQQAEEKPKKRGRGRPKKDKDEPQVTNSAATVAPAQTRTISTLDRSIPLEDILTSLWDRGYNVTVSPRQL